MKAEEEAQLYERLRLKVYEHDSEGLNVEEGVRIAPESRRISEEEQYTRLKDKC